MRLTYDEFRRLNVGDKVLYSAGLSEHFIQAMATISQLSGTTGVYIRLDTIESKGDQVTCQEGEVILAGLSELGR